MPSSPCGDKQKLPFEQTTYRVLVENVNDSVLFFSKYDSRRFKGVGGKIISRCFPGIAGERRTPYISNSISLYYQIELQKR